jgi:DNA-binding transcriptional LysR family regulator
VNWHFKIEPDLRRLRAYLAISDCGSVQGAAAKLNLMQSALSRALKQLECQLGLALFERTRRGMVPTEIGGILRERVRRAMLQLDREVERTDRGAREGRNRASSQGLQQ